MITVTAAAAAAVTTAAAAAANDAAATATAAPLQGREVRARVLVCADGSTSRLATQLGHCTEPPQGISSRAYIEGGTHNTNFDGVCFYPRWSLPG